MFEQLRNLDFILVSLGFVKVYFENEFKFYFS